jgi:hypothetical protein
LHQSIHEAERPNQVHTFEGTQGGGGNGKDGEGKKSERVEYERLIRANDQNGDPPKCGKEKLQGECSRNEFCDFAFPGDLAYEISIGTEIGERVADEDKRPDHGELTEGLYPEAARNQGYEEDCQPLRSYAGKQEPE